MVGNSDDLIITSLITQAREYCEGFQGRKYVTQTLEAYMDIFPNGSIEFRNASPVQSITSIIYTDRDGVDTTFAATDYSLDDVSFINKIDIAYGKAWPSVALKPANGIKIRFIAGYGDAAMVPEAVKWAMILHMKLLYDDYSPEERKYLEAARDNLLSMNRVIPV